MQELRATGLTLALKGINAETPLSEGYVYFYDTKYLLNAIHYALAINLNKHHQLMKQNGILPDMNCNSPPQASSQRRDSTSLEYSYRLNIINSDHGQRQTHSQNLKQAFKQPKKTSANQGDSEESQKDFPSNKQHIFYRIVSGDSRDQKQKLKNKVEPSSCQTIQFQELPSQWNPQTTEAPRMGLSRAQLLQRQIGLLQRQVDAWPARIKKNRGNREINSLKG